ncbi:MAG: hypothetical protein FJ267_00225, partial [Planctomycetes bacterium]|nr:hypothetical protein [Planctomycetota bacterium]
DRKSLTERQSLIDALEKCGGNKAQAARILGIPRSTFFSKLKKHGIGDSTIEFDDVKRVPR